MKKAEYLENQSCLQRDSAEHEEYAGVRSVDNREVGETEVDFVAETPNDKIYIQVTETMLSPETRERELRPLRMIPDNYEKIVLSMDRSFITSYDGIKSLNLIDWLLS